MECAVVLTNGCCELRNFATPQRSFISATQNEDDMAKKCFFYGNFMLQINWNAMLQGCLIAMTRRRIPLARIEHFASQNTLGVIAHNREFRPLSWCNTNLHGGITQASFWSSFRHRFHSRFYPAFVNINACKIGKRQRMMCGHKAKNMPGNPGDKKGKW